MYPRLIENLIEKLTKLPGVGRRSAERIVFWLLNQTNEDAQALSDSITALKNNLMFCQECNNFSDAQTCNVCRDNTRDKAMICVVENPKDVLAVEKTGSYRGLYHILLGTINPSEGKGPEDLKIHHLLERVRQGGIKEVIIATDADNEGEMTAIYLIKQLKDTGVKVSRIGVGIPAGSSLEYADMSTLSMSFMGRREVV